MTKIHPRCKFTPRVYICTGVYIVHMNEARYFTDVKFLLITDFGVIFLLISDFGPKFYWLLIFGPKLYWLAIFWPNFTD